MRDQMRRIGRTLLVAAASIALVSAQKPTIGAPAPDFELTMVDGSKLTLGDLRGNVIVLNFWATWCVPCRTELPLLDRYYELSKDRGLRVITIATEDSLPLYQLKKLFAVMKIPSARRIKGPYGTMTGLPTNFVIDRAGRVRYAKAGAFDLADLNALLVPLLDEPTPPSPTF